MPRKNSRVGKRKTRREFRQNHKAGTVRPPPIPIEATVVPKGKCFIRTRYGKLRFTAEEVKIALRHAQHNRATQRSGKVEERYYPCEDGRPEGCGFWHLTSRSEYKPRTP